MSTTLKRVHGYLAEFDNVQDLYHAAEHVRDAGYNRWDVHTPFPVHGMDKAMGNPRSILPKLVFCGGITGTGLGKFGETLGVNDFGPAVGKGVPCSPPSFAGSAALAVLSSRAWIFSASSAGSVVTANRPHIPGRIGVWKRGPHRR